MNGLKRLSAPILAFVLLLTTSGCITVPRDYSLVNESSAATVPDFPKARFNSDDPDLSLRFEQSLRSEVLPRMTMKSFDVLALSGGGADGAFGAGVLTGWTQRGDRPEFSMVTGVSTGALIAPFAFLGSAYDGKLTEAYTSGIASHLTDNRGILSIFTPGIFHAGNLRKLVEHYVDDDLIRAIGQESLKGRRLFVATTNLDTQQGIVWDITAIAHEALLHPEKTTAARQLICQILVASASIPGAFAPVMIETTTVGEVGGSPTVGTTRTAGRLLREMHVDGSVALPLFILPESMLSWDVPDDIKRKGHVYVLVNGKINPAYTITQNNAVSIAARSLETITKAQARATLLGLKAFTERNGLSVSVLSLPDDFVDGGMMAFDTKSMGRVYDLGHSLGVSPHNWTDK